MLNMEISTIQSILNRLNMPRAINSYRLKAMCDLLAELNKESFTLDLPTDASPSLSQYIINLETYLCDVVLQKLDDIAGGVSGVAIECLASLVKKVCDDSIVDMAIKLSHKLLDPKYGDPNVTGIAMKTILSEVPSLSAAQSVLDSVVPQLLTGITGTGNESSRKRKAAYLEKGEAEAGEAIKLLATQVAPSTVIKFACLGILYDILRRYGNLISSYHEVILQELLLQLSCNGLGVREKTVSCIASLASSLSDDVLGKAINGVGLLKTHGTESDMTCTYIQIIESLSYAVGYRFGPYLGDTIPVLISYCRSASDELCECSFKALKSFLLMCPRDISSYCDDILHLTLQYLSYNPNISDGETLEEEEEDDESEKEYTDDEEDGLRVRSAAARCLFALIVSRPEMLSDLCVKAIPKLIDKFNESEENTKIVVFNTFIGLLRQIGLRRKGQDDNEMIGLLKQEVPNIVGSVMRQLRKNSVKTKVRAFSVLKELVVVLTDCLADHIDSLIPPIEKAFCDKSCTSELKIEALIFTKLVLVSHSPSVFHPHIKALSTPVLSALSGCNYEVTVEALRVCGELVRVIRPNVEGTEFDFKPHVHPLYKAIASCLTNQDPVVKECAISCMGLVISTFGDNLRVELPVCLPVLVAHMGKGSTRLTAVKAFDAIAASPLRIDISCVLTHVVDELTAYLKYARGPIYWEKDRELGPATLRTLNSLSVAYDDKIGLTAYEVIITELSTLISDSDLHITALALQLCCTLMAKKRSTTNIGLTVIEKVLPQTVKLLISVFPQGEALLSLQNFFAELVCSASTSFDALLESLISTANGFPQSGGVANPALSSIAQCVAVLCLATGDKKCSSTVAMLTDILNGVGSTNSAKQHALLCLGEIGRREDLSSHANIETIIIEFFQSPFEDIKSAASCALGNIAIGNLSNYLPFILDQIDNQQKKQYLLLHSLKEVIVRLPVDKAELNESSVDKILNLLFNHCESEEEGVRNVVAKCLGKIALIKPTKLVPALKERTSSPAAFTRATVVVALKYCLVEQQAKIDEIIYPEMSSFLMLIKDADMHVRRASVLALNTAAHNKPNLIRDLLPELLPLLYKTSVEKELTRRVDVVDDGPELRKAAFECVDTLLDSCPDRVNPSSFIVPYLKSGLEDHYDVKMRCHLMLSKLADTSPAAVYAVIDSLVDPLLETINFRPKQDAMKQEVDRNEDMIQSALRAIASLECLRRLGCFTSKFTNFLSDIEGSPTMGPKYSAIKKENRLMVTYQNRFQ